MNTNRIFIAAAAILLIAGCEEPELQPVKTEKPAAVVQRSDEKLQEFTADIKALLPEFALFGASAGRETELLDSTGNILGVIRCAPEKYSRTEGFNGFINTALVIKERRIIGVVIGKNSETPRWLAKVRRAGFLTRWNGSILAEAAEMEVDAVTGATYSCEAIKGEVKAVAAP